MPGMKNQEEDDLLLSQSQQEHLPSTSISVGQRQQNPKEKYEGNEEGWVLEVMSSNK